MASYMGNPAVWLKGWPAETRPLTPIRIGTGTGGGDRESPMAHRTPVVARVSAASFQRANSTTMGRAHQEPDVRGRSLEPVRWPRGLQLIGTFVQN